MKNKKYLGCAISFERFDDYASVCIVYENGKIDFDKWVCENQKNICEMYMYYSNRGGYIDTFSIEDLGYEFHHSEKIFKYVSNENRAGVAEPYKGCFGEGIIIDIPYFNNKWYTNRMYFIKEG